jgi:hypothetical protein
MKSNDSSVRTLRLGFWRKDPIRASKSESGVDHERLTYLQNWKDNGGMMWACNNRVTCLLGCFIFAAVLLLPHASSGDQGRTASDPQPGRSGKEPVLTLQPVDYSKDIRKRGKTILVSKDLADKIRADSIIVTSAVTVKASVDKKGKGNGYIIVAVDKGSLAARLGIAARDVIQEVNGLKLISSDDIKNAEEKLRGSTNFKLKILRGGRTRTLYYEIR